MKRLLVIEDDEALSRGIALALSNPQRRVEQVSSLAAARDSLMHHRYDLLLLDVNLPDGDGFSFCREVRQTQRMPVIVLTARSLEIDIVTGLDYGADDYITKPFSLMVLRARVDAVLRRYEETAGQPLPYTRGAFFFDFDSMVFKKDNEPIELSKTEQKLLKYLVANENQVLPREMLIEKIWSVDSEFVDENALSVTVKRLRQKIEDSPTRPQFIKTVYGIGYRWEGRV